MQVTKDYIKNNIQEAARQLFLDKGYADVSMREIAEKAQVGLSNIYNYFKNKDELFLLVVQPAIEAFDQFLNPKDPPYTLGIFAEESARHQLVSKYLSLIEHFKPQIDVLLFRSKDSSLENFKADFTKKAADKVKRQLLERQEPHSAPSLRISDFAIHMHIVWLFTLFEEAIKSGFSRDELESSINDYIQFETNDYRKLA